MANINTDMLKEKLNPVVSALFGISETLVDVSKCHISAEHAIDKIRSYMRQTDVICSRYRLDKVLDECTEIENDSISRSEAISNLMKQPKLTKSVVRRVLAQTNENDASDIVRCKDCKHYGCEQEPCHGKTVRFCKLHKGLALIHKETFCSYGERRADDGRSKVD